MTSFVDGAILRVIAGRIAPAYLACTTGKPMMKESEAEAIFQARNCCPSEGLFRATDKNQRRWPARAADPAR